MASAILMPLDRQVARVHRRLVLQSLLNAFLWSLAGAIGLSAGWLLVQTYLLPEPYFNDLWVRWIGIGIIAAGGLAAAITLGIWRAPRKLTAALSLDERFGLKERVTTSLTLTREQEATPAGQALLADVNQRLRDLDVGSRFPLRLAWPAALASVGAVLFATAAVLLTMLFAPTTGSASAVPPPEGPKPPQNQAQIEQKMQELKKTNREKTELTRNKSEEIERLEAELEKIANRPRDSREQLRERVKEMTALEENMKGREKELAEKVHSLKQQLQHLDSSSKQDSDGPAKDLQKALGEGKFDKAHEELERLKRRLQNNEMTAKEKEQLKKQLKNLKEKMERLAQQKDKQEKLKQAKLDPETLQREMSQLKKDSQKLSDLQDLADQLGKCEKCLNDGNMEGAAKSLRDASNKTKQMEGDSEDLKDLQESLQNLSNAKGACCDGMGENEVSNNGDLEEDMDNAGQASGRRPDGKKTPTRSVDTKSRAEFDPKGKKIFDGYAPGQNFKKKSGADLVGEIKQASQEASEAIEQQRIPKAAREMTKGYFQRMRELAEKEQKSADKP